LVSDLNTSDVTTVSYYPLLILLAPLLAALVIAASARLIGTTVSRIGVMAEFFAFAFSLRVLNDVITGGPQVVDVWPLIDSESGILHFGLYIDRLGAVVMVHITAISTLIHVFSIRYMQQERGYARFHSLISLTTFVLLGMVTSANLLMLFIFWQLLSWLLSLLSYNYAHPATARGAYRTFSMLRIGDIAFLFAIVIAYNLYGTLDLRLLFIRAGEVLTIFSILPVWGLEINASTAITLMIFIGAMSKSAQFPLHMWLPDSLYAPTPVHALLHAGIINAGGFLLTRLAPLYDLSPTTLHVVFAIGLLTAILGSSMMLTQNDIKKTLGYSTIGQMGFMIMECGLGAYGLAMFHLIAHGIFKATIFLNCGHVIHAARHEPRLPPQDDDETKTEFSKLSWLTGFGTTLVLPLIILLAGHGALRIPLEDSQGTVIFLFFGWATSSQAILTVYRLRAVASWKVALTMLLSLFVVIVTYLFAAESFTHFLFPAAGEVASHFRAGALPGAVFDLVVGGAALLIIIAWILIYADAHGRSVPLPPWVRGLQIRFYLLLMNRLYLDAISRRIGERLTRTTHRLNASKIFFYGISLTAVVAALSVSVLPEDLSFGKIARFFSVGAILPLFPLHGLYVAAVTRTRSYIACGLAFAMPMVGLYGIADLLLTVPPEFRSGIRILALFGALYGSLKALAQSQYTPLLSYAGLSFYSILWWHVANTETLSTQAAVYFSAVVLITVGLLLAWHYVQARYGDLAADRLGGLAHPMPRLTTLVALIVMAAVGLPPFGLFSGYMGMLLHPSTKISWELSIIVLAWFAASVYLFRIMQQLLFGPRRTDISYEDLRPAEVASLLILLLSLLAVGLLPNKFLVVDLMTYGSILLGR
jgi:NADH-quinone oxidoreductase subunit L